MVTMTANNESVKARVSENDSSGRPGAATAGTSDLPDDHDLLAQALSKVGYEGPQGKSAARPRLMP